MNGENDQRTPPVKHWSRLCPQSRNPVHCRGEALDDPLWQGEQWAVTTYGLECRDGTYHVQKEKFWQWMTDPQEVMVYWFNHLGGKKWVDQDDVDHAIQAMLVLYHKDGSRTSVEAPYLMDEADIEARAQEAAERAYRITKDRLIHRLPL